MYLCFLGAFSYFPLGFFAAYFIYYPLKKCLVIHSSPFESYLDLYIYLIFFYTNKFLIKKNYPHVFS